ncbi:hypothetical protein ACUHMQ_11980 [Chitinimonas sp. PSY-7]|uniref:hypothetical protein n=1 Tax=Chitinimonas sp. PSY-7 TaxID=3459088 RepID=UPI00403FD2C0
MQILNNKVNETPLIQQLAGTYHLIGLSPITRKPYSGRAVLVAYGNKLNVIRTINGMTITGTAAIKSVAANQPPVLRMCFPTNEKDVEATYLWHFDLNNNIRLTGEIHVSNNKNDSPALEAFFPNATEFLR